MSAADVEQAWRDVDETTAALDAAKADVDALYERRRAAFHVLLDAGEPQAVIARRAKITPMAVAYAVGKPKPKSKEAAAKK